MCGIVGYIEDNASRYIADKKLEINRIGSTIGTHVGLGAIALSFVKNK